MIALIDLLLTSKTCKFKNSYVIRTSLSVFHKMKFTYLTMQFFKVKLRLLLYRNYTKFSNETFINSINVKLSTKSISPDGNEFLIFCKLCTEILNKYEPRKRKTTIENQSSFINKKVWKAIMKLTGLRRDRSKLLNEVEKIRFYVTPEKQKEKMLMVNCVIWNSPSLQNE